MITYQFRKDTVSFYQLWLKSTGGKGGTATPSRKGLSCYYKGNGNFTNQLWNNGQNNTQLASNATEQSTLMQQKDFAEVVMQVSTVRQTWGNKGSLKPFVRKRRNTKESITSGILNLIGKSDNYRHDCIIINRKGKKLRLLQYNPNS